MDFPNLVNTHLEPGPNSAREARSREFLYGGAVEGLVVAAVFGREGALVVGAEPPPRRVAFQPSARLALVAVVP